MQTILTTLEKIYTGTGSGYITLSINPLTSVVSYIYAIL